MKNLKSSSALWLNVMKYFKIEEKQWQQMNVNGELIEKMKKWTKKRKLSDSEQIISKTK